MNRVQLSVLRRFTRLKHSPVEEGEVDSAIAVALVEMDGVGGVEERRVEQNTSVLAIRNGRGVRVPFCVKLGLELIQLVLVVVLASGPMCRGPCLPNHHASRRWVEVGIVAGDPAVDVDGGLVGVDPNTVTPAVVVFVAPEHGDGVVAEDGRQNTGELAGDLREKGCRPTVFEVRTQVPPFLHRAPHRGFLSEGDELVQDLVGEDAVDDSDRRR
mmetsp:Transcript_55518/g.131021  ORF Transcript_55518/g.131021 Transcript_55518/m.131021 type:complete len:214 (+) Transcript_55518:698-1339(+)